MSSTKDFEQNNIIEFEKDTKWLLDVAAKKAGRAKYVNALSIVNKVLDEDENCVEALLELSSIYSKLGMVDNSTYYAHKAMCINENESSYYIIGTNFIKKHLYYQGVGYYKKMLDLYPEGEYSEYGEMVIERLDEDDRFARETRIMNLINRGRYYIEVGRYNKAIRLYSLMYNFVEKSSINKNNLALAYFYNKQAEKAIRLTKEVIKQNKYDISANCNLALFYSKLRRKVLLNGHMPNLDKINPSMPEEYLKLISTLCECKEHERVIATIKRAICSYSFDITYMFLMASAYYNLGKFTKALSLFLDILKIDKNNYVAYYYKKYISSINKPKYIDYYMQLPLVAIIDGVKRLKILVNMTSEELQENFSEEDRLLTLWCATYKDDEIKLIAVRILTKVGGEKIIEDLKQLLFSSYLQDDIKKDILGALKMLNVEEPYNTIFGGDIAKVNVSVASINSPKGIDKHQQAIDLFASVAKEGHSSLHMANCINTYVDLNNNEIYFNSLGGACAAIELYELNKIDEKVDLSVLALGYKTTVKTLKAYYEKIVEYYNKTTT